MAATDSVESSSDSAVEQNSNSVSAVQVLKQRVCGLKQCVCVWVMLKVYMNEVRHSDREQSKEVKRTCVQRWLHSNGHGVKFDAHSQAVRH